MLAHEIESLLLALDFDGTSSFIQRLASLPDEVLWSLLAAGAACGVILLAALVMIARSRFTHINGQLPGVLPSRSHPPSWPHTRPIGAGTGLGVGRPVA